MLFDVLAYEVCKLVRVLAHCWHTNSTTPIEVQICELKAQKMCAKMHSMQFGTGGGDQISRACIHGIAKFCIFSDPLT